MILSTDALLLIDLGDRVVTFLDERAIFAGSDASAMDAESRALRPTVVVFNSMVAFWLMEWKWRWERREMS